MIIRRRPGRVLACAIALATLTLIAAPGRAAEDDSTFAVSIDSPSVKVGQRAAIVATISARGAYRITESYRHRVQNLAAGDGGVQLPGKVVRGAVSDGRVVFRIEVLPTTAGAHTVVGVLRFSINDGQHLDIKALPFEATVTATE